MKRFITLVTAALIVAAVVKQRQRVKELGRRVLSRGITEETSVSAEENKALARRWFEDLFNAGNLEVADEIIAPEHVNHDPTLADIPPGPEGQEQVNLYRGAFTNVHISVEEQLAEGDKVVTRWSASGTHQGELMGVAPTGNQVTITGLTINRLSDGKIAESWSNYDALGMMQQIGAIPEPGVQSSGTPTAGQEPPS
jgi:predicted SnoaL-like aldol condensation-catalyzing enzyme